MTLEEAELDALDFASEMAGEYLNELGKTDLAKFTNAEWLQLLSVIVTNFKHKSAELQTVPF